MGFFEKLNNTILAVGGTVLMLCFLAGIAYVCYGGSRDLFDLATKGIVSEAKVLANHKVSCGTRKRRRICEYFILHVNELGEVESQLSLSHTIGDILTITYIPTYPVQVREGLRPSITTLSNFEYAMLGALIVSSAMFAYIIFATLMLPLKLLRKR